MGIEPWLVQLRGLILLCLFIVFDIRFGDHIDNSVAVESLTGVRSGGGICARSRHGVLLAQHFLEMAQRRRLLLHG